MNSLDTDASVLMNAHYDSPVNSPGAGDCGSCVGEFGTISLDLPSKPLNHGFMCFRFAASLLELARLVVDSGWVPPQPVIFLFNGAEELFMLVIQLCCLVLFRMEYCLMNIHLLVLDEYCY